MNEKAQEVELHSKESILTLLLEGEMSNKPQKTAKRDQQDFTAPPETKTPVTTQVIIILIVAIIGLSFMFMRNHLHERATADRAQADAAAAVMSTEQ